MKILLYYINIKVIGIFTTKQREHENFDIREAGV